MRLQEGRLPGTAREAAPHASTTSVLGGCPGHRDLRLTRSTHPIPHRQRSAEAGGLDGQSSPPHLQQLLRVTECEHYVRPNPHANCLPEPKTCSPLRKRIDRCNAEIEREKPPLPSSSGSRRHLPCWLGSGSTPETLSSARPPGQPIGDHAKNESVCRPSALLRQPQPAKPATGGSAGATRMRSSTRRMPTGTRHAMERHLVTCFDEEPGAGGLSLSVSRARR